MDLLKDIESALLLCRSEQKREGAKEYIAPIVDILERMRLVVNNELKHDNQQRSSTATALGRLVMDDFSFSESEIGEMILKIASSFRRSRS